MSMSGVKMSTRKRQQKTTSDQRKIYCDFLEKYPEICHSKTSDNIVQNLWEELTNLLNAEKGPCHNKDEWKKVFDNWRYVTTYKAKNIKIDYEQTEGGLSTDRPTLTPLEERAMTQWGKIVVDGNPKLNIAEFAMACSPDIREEEDIDDSSYTQMPPSPSASKQNRKSQAKPHSQCNADTGWHKRWVYVKDCHVKPHKNIPDSDNTVDSIEFFTKYLHENAAELIEDDSLWEKEEYYLPNEKSNAQTSGANNESTNISKTKPQKRKRSCSKSKSSNVRIKLLKQITEKLECSDDETDLFFASMAKTVKKLPEKDRAEIRLKIAILIGKAEIANLSAFESITQRQ